MTAKHYFQVGDYARCTGNPKLAGHVSWVSSDGLWLKLNGGEREYWHQHFESLEPVSARRPQHRAGQRAGLFSRVEFLIALSGIPLIPLSILIVWRLMPTPWGAVVAALSLVAACAAAFALALNTDRVAAWLSPRYRFLREIKAICLANGYTEGNWEHGAHDWRELYTLGYRDADDAFAYALSCE